MSDQGIPFKDILNALDHPEVKDKYSHKVTLSDEAVKTFSKGPEGNPKSVVDELVDVVNNPSHYTQYPVEVIELTENMNFCRGNAVKYIARAGLKDPEKEIEDLEKAEWYIKREVARLKEEKNNG